MTKSKEKIDRNDCGTFAKDLCQLSIGAGKPARPCVTRANVFLTQRALAETSASLHPDMPVPLHVDYRPR